MKSGSPVLLACDTRPSSLPLCHAVIAALLSCGCRVIDGGVMPAGMLHFLIPALGFGGGLMISGGHQAAGWNAIIPFDADGAYFDDIQRRELFDLYHARRFAEANYEEILPVEKLDPAALNAYWDSLRAAVDTEAIRRAHFTVIGDYCNGAGSAFAARFAEIFNLNQIAVNDGDSGVVSREPEPRPRSESPIRAVIRPLGAALGLVFNSDMSRLGLLSDTGEPLSEELTSPLAIDYLLEKYGPATVIGNTCSSRTLDEVVAARGGKLEKVKVGQANIIGAMKRFGAPFGGEGSGSFAYGTLRGFDGFRMAALFLEMLALRGSKLSEQLKALPRFHIVKKTLPSPSAHGYALLRRLKGRFGDAELSELDGLRFDWEDGWLSLRISNTEPVIRLISESKRRTSAIERAWQARAMLESTVLR